MCLHKCLVFEWSQNTCFVCGIINIVKRDFVILNDNLPIMPSLHIFRAGVPSFNHTESSTFISGSICFSLWYNIFGGVWVYAFGAIVVFGTIL